MSLSVRASNGLMRAGADTLEKLYGLMKKENGLAGVRNLGVKSIREITEAFLAVTYSMLTVYEKLLFWQELLDKKRNIL